MQKVTNNIFVEVDYIGANVGLVKTAAGLIMIDTPFLPSDALNWRDTVVSKGEVRYIINTEHHVDHFTGNYFFSGTVVSHQEARRLILQTPLEQVKERVKQQIPQDLSLLDENYHARVPTITFTDQMSIYLGEHTFHLIFLPGHTSGQIAVHIPEERVLFTSDNIFCKVQTWMQDSDPFKWLESLNKIAEIDADVLVPGHGEVCGKSYIQEQSAFIQEWITAVRGAIDQGQSKEMAMDKISLLDRYPMAIGGHKMGPTLQRWNVERIYNLLTTKE